MKYKNNKIVYEVGDWVAGVLADDSFFGAGCVGELSEYDGRDWWSRRHTGNPQYPNCCIGKEYMFRPATQEEVAIDKVEEKIMVGEYAVEFCEAPKGRYINVGCVKVWEETFLKIGKKAGWL